MASGLSDEPPPKRQRTENPTAELGEPSVISGHKGENGAPFGGPDMRYVDRSQSTTSSESFDEDNSSSEGTDPEHNAPESLNSTRPNQDRNQKSENRRAVRQYRKRELNVYAAVAGRIRSYGSSNLRPKHQAQPLTPAEVLFNFTSAPTRYEHPSFDLYDAHRWIGQMTRGDVYKEACELDEIRRWTGGTGEVPGLPEDEEESFRTINVHSPVMKPTFLKPHAKSSDERSLPSSDLLKTIHRYCSVFYAAVQADPPHGTRSKRKVGRPKRVTHRGSSFDFRSMDETALLAMGILLEETCREYSAPLRSDDAKGS